MSPAPAQWRQVAGRVTRQVDYGASHFWLDLAIDEAFGTPAPGQFVQFLLPSHASSAVLPRPMSVAAARRGANGLELGFLYSPVGAGTQALAALAPGSRVEVLGPLGQGYPLATPGTPVLVAGGRGVAPLLFAADVLAAEGRRCEFLFGARSLEHLVGVDDARTRIEQLGGRLHLCTDDGSHGFHGNVVELLASLAPRLPASWAIHSCGPHAMLGAVAAWASQREVPAYLAMESVMACGTGICRGCPLPRSAAGRAAFGEAAPSLAGNRDFAMCCTEGPVFEAAELDWELIH